MSGEMIKYSGKQIIKAGDTLATDNIAEENPQAFEAALEILSYWRTSHEYPLSEAVEILSKSAKKYDSNAVIAKRLKRAPSIINKLRRFKKEGMKLRTMQDIGGCRAILSNEKRVRKLVRDLKNKMNFKIKDYISKPKGDGYRSIHLVGEFPDEFTKTKSIEIQVRTDAQHSWATAVEIIDLFTGEAIKSNQGSEDWKRFFYSVGEQFALIEDIPVYNQIRPNILKAEILKRLKSEVNPIKSKRAVNNIETLYLLGEKLRVLSNFQGYANSLKVADEHVAKESMTGYILLKVDTLKCTIYSKIYDEKNFYNATNDYLNEEKNAALNKEIVIALVSTESLGGIKEAFPNYFADSDLFIKYVYASMEAYKAYNPSSISRVIKKLLS